MKKVLVTGLTGFAGSHLAEELVKNTNLEIHGTYLNEESITNVEDIKDHLTLHQINLLEQDAVEKLVQEVSPQETYHLAAFPSPAESFKSPAFFMQNNITAEVYLLEALVKFNLPETKVLIVASSEVYGLVKPEDLPINEETQLRPTSPYGVSKIAQDYLGLQYYLSHGIKTIRVRPFPHIGARLSPQFASSAFAKKIAEIEKGKREPVVTVGNLESKRDLTDVRDMVKAYVLLMQKGKFGDIYNIGSGVSYKTQFLLDTLLSFSSHDIKVEQDPALLRPIDIPELRCDNTKIKQATNWQPTYKIEDSLRDLLEYWREIV